MQRGNGIFVHSNSFHSPFLSGCPISRTVIEQLDVFIYASLLESPYVLDIVDDYVHNNYASPFLLLRVLLTSQCASQLLISLNLPRGKKGKLKVLFVNLHMD